MFYSPKRKYNYDIKNDEEHYKNNVDNENEIIDSNKNENDISETKLEILEFNNKEYNLNFGYTSKNNSIFFELSPKNNDSFQNLYFYKGAFSYSELTKLCKSFKMYDSIQEIFSSFCILFQNKKVFLKSRENNSFDLFLLVNSVTGKEEEVCFSLEKHNIIKENEVSNNISNNNLEEKEKELNLKIDNLENNLRQENYDLKNEIYYLKNDVNRYIKTIDNNKKEIKNLKDQIRILKNNFELKIKELSVKIDKLSNQNINNDLIQNNNNEIKENKTETSENSKSQKNVKISDISNKKNKSNNNSNILINSNQKKNIKIENQQNKFIKNQEKMKNNKREIYKQIKEENSKKLNLNKEKTSFSEFLKQKKSKNNNKVKNKLTKSYTSIGDNLQNKKIKAKLDADKFDENNEEEYEVEDNKNSSNVNENNIKNNNDENDRCENESESEGNEEQYEEDDNMNPIKKNEINRSDMIDQWTQDFNLNVKKLLEDNDIKLRFTEKLNYMNRRIITKVEELQLIENQLKGEYDNIKDIEYNLIYRSSEHGDSAKIFHERCNIKNNLVIIKTKNNIKFGGYTQESWEGEKIFKKDNNAFYFCLNKNKIYEIEEKSKAIYCDEKMGPCFGDKLFQIFDNFLTKGGFCSKKYKSELLGFEDGFETTNGLEEFSIEELEVYELKLITN